MDKLHELYESVKLRFPERYGNLEGEALGKAIWEDFYAPGATGFKDSNGDRHGLAEGGTTFTTFSELKEALANRDSEDPETKSRTSDYVTSALVGGGIGLMMGGPPGMVVGAASGLVGTATDHALSKIDLNKNEVPDIPGYLRFPASVLTGGGVSRVGGRVVNRGLGLLQEGAEQYLDDASRLNVTPRAGDIDTGVQGVEDFLTAARSGPAVRQASNQANQMRNAAQQFADDVAPKVAGKSSDRVVADLLEDGYKVVKQQSTALFDDASRAAQGSTVPLDSTRSTVAQVVEELKDVPGGTVDRLAKTIQQAIDDGNPISYSRLRNWQKALNELVDNPLAATGVGDGRAKFLLSSIADDMDSWATSNLKTGGEAHNVAMEYFKNSVAPYRVDRVVFRAATGAEDGTDQLISKIVGSGRGNPDRVQRVMALLPQSGRDAIARDVAQTAAWSSNAAHATTDFAPSKLFNKLNMGTPNMPRTGTHVFQNTPGALDDANALSRMAQVTRATGSQSQPLTGIQNLAPNINAASTLAGGAVGSALVPGGSGMAVGAALGQPVYRGLLNLGSRVVGSRPFVQTMMANPGNYSSGLAGTALGPVPGLLEQSRWARNRR